ncbi:hypothetical protein [Flavobacterium sp. 22076]|uniref:hypothetical protein n=1 Tax=unclassified Flavobacterium TaxID=196869 RepID=UPI003F82746E
MKFIKHDIEKLHELLVFFFNKIDTLDPKDFDSNTLFPDWYSNLPISKMDKLEKLLTEFIHFEKSLKQKIIKSFTNSNNIQELFQNDKLEINTARDFSTDFWKKKIGKKNKEIDLKISDFLSDLFTYLYSTQLGNKNSTFCKKTGVDLKSFYNSFVEANSVNYIENLVCPYCGLEKMRDVRKPDHDHLLPKGNDLFVFSSVNSKNLFPSGADCNIEKDTKLLLYSDYLVTRTTAFYPYSPVPHPFQLMSFNLLCNEIPNYSNSFKGQWEVEITPMDTTDLKTRQNINSWNRVFNIKERYERVISNSNKSYIDKELQFTKIKNINELTEKLNDQRDRLPLNYFMLSTEIDVIPKKIFFNWAISEIAYLQTLIDLNTSTTGVNVDINF